MPSAAQGAENRKELFKMSFHIGLIHPHVDVARRMVLRRCYPLSEIAELTEVQRDAILVLAEDLGVVLPDTMGVLFPEAGL